MSENDENDGEIKVGEKGSLRRVNRRTITIIAIVVFVLAGFVVATSVMTVSKLRITLVNNSGDVLLFGVMIDEFNQGRSVTLGPLESVSFSWNITGWLHKYDIFAHDPNIIVTRAISWTYIIVLPFTEKVVTYQATVPS